MSPTQESKHGDFLQPRSQSQLISLLIQSSYPGAIGLISDLLSAEVVSIFLIDSKEPERLERIATTSTVKASPWVYFSGPKAAPSGLTAYHASWYKSRPHDNKPLLLRESQLKALPYVAQSPPRHLPSKRCVSRLVFPLRTRKGTFFGLVTADNKIFRTGLSYQLKEFSPSDLSIASEVKVTLENAIEMTRVFYLFDKLAEKLKPDMTIDNLLVQILDVAMTLLDADRGDFVGPDPRSQKPICRAQRGPSPAGVRIGANIPVDSFIGHLLRSKESYAIAPDVAQADHYHQADPRTRSEIAIKLSTPQGRLFSLNLESFREQFFDANDLRLLKLLIPYVESRVAQVEGRETITLYKDLIVGNLQEMVFVKDIEGRFVFVSRRLAKFLGREDPQKVIGKKDENFFRRHPEMVAGFVAGDRKVITSGKPSDWYVELCQPDNQKEPRRINVFKAPVFMSEGIASLVATAGGTPPRSARASNGRRVVGVLGIFHDITSEVRLQKAQALVRAGNILWRKRTDRVEISESVWDLFGIAKKKRLDYPPGPAVLSREILDRVHDGDKANLIAAYNRLQREVMARRESRGRHPVRLTRPVVFRLCDKPRWLRLTYENSFEITNDPESEFVIIVVQDITELQETIQRLEEMQQSLMAKNEDLKAAKERLLRGNQGLILGALSRATLHDAQVPIDLVPAAVKNIVSSLRSLPKLVKQQAKDIKGAIETLEMLSTACAEAHTHIEHLRVLSNNPRRLAHERIDVKEVLQQCCWTETPTTQEKGIQVEILSSKNLPLVLSDAIALRVAFANLVRNAIIYGCPQGSDKVIKITLSFDQRRNGISVEIRDSGPGFSADIVKHVHEPYSTTIQADGMGFGLIIAKTIFKLTRGDLRLSPGPGACCNVFLPAAKPPRRMNRE